MLGCLNKRLELKASPVESPNLLNLPDPPSLFVSSPEFGWGPVGLLCVLRVLCGES